MMMFHAPTGRMVLPADAIKSGAMHMRWALKNIREAAGLPLDRYERHGPLEKADFAQIAVIEAAEAMGIDLGAPRMRFNELDLRGEL
jgi:hypothetical protein